MGSSCLMGTEFQFGKIKKVLQMDGGDGYKTMSRYLIPLTHPLKNGEDGKFHVTYILP